MISLKGGDKVTTDGEMWLRVITLMPHRISSYLRRSVRECPDEIRLKSMSKIVVRTNDKTEVLDCTVTSDELFYVIRSLSSSSLYAYSETLKEGFITTEDGIRAGITGKATVINGVIHSLTSFDSVVIRIPKRFPDAADKLIERLKRSNFAESVILCAPPSGGKTTVIREAARKLSDDPYYLPLAFVDTRCESGAVLRDTPANVLSCYPRAKGVEIALRVLSVKMIITDETSTDEDADALLCALGCGVGVLTTAHGRAKDIKNCSIYKRISSFASITLCDVIKKPSAFDFVFYDK